MKINNYNFSSIGVYIYNGNIEEILENTSLKNKKIVTFELKGL